MAQNQAFGSVIGTAGAIPAQLKVVSRERAAKLYDVLPFYVATCIVQLPLELIPQLLFGLILYAATGLRPGWDHALIYVAVLVAENFAGIALGMFLRASFEDVSIMWNMKAMLGLIIGWNFLAFRVLVSKKPQFLKIVMARVPAQDEVMGA